MANDQDNHLYNIDLLRFLFSLVIINHHLFVKPFLFVTMKGQIPLLNSIWAKSLKGYLGVEFFFILAGVWLGKTIESNNLDIKTFVQRKIIRLWPVLAFSILCFWIVSLFGLTKFQKYSDVLNLLFLQSNGLTLSFGDNETAWFVSCLFWVSIFYFSLYKTIQSKSFYFIVSMIVYFCFVLMINNKSGSFNCHLKPVIFSLFNFGMIRAAAEIGLGIGLWKIFSALSEKNSEPSLTSKILYGSAELFLLIVIFNNLAFRHFKFANDLFLTLAIAGLILLFMLKRGGLSLALNQKFFGKLGAVSYSIYMMQEVFFVFLAKGLSVYYNKLLTAPDSVILTVYIGCLIAPVCLGTITYALVEKQSVIRMLRRNK